MLKQRGRLVHTGIFLLDLGLVAVGFLLSYWVRSAVLPLWLPRWYPSQLYPLDRYLPLLPLALVCWGVVLVATGTYRSHRTLRLQEEVTSVVRVTLLSSVVWTVAIFVLRLDVTLLADDRVSRSWIVLLAVFSCAFLLIEKLALRILSGYVRQRGYNFRTLLIVGTNSSARELARSIQSHVTWGFRLLGFIKTRAEDPDPTEPLSSPLLGSIADLPRITREMVVDDVVFAVNHRELGDLEEPFLMLQEQGIRTRFALTLMPTGYSRIDLEELDGAPLLSFARTPTSYPLLTTKRLVDISISAVLLVFGLPVVLMIALLIKISSAGDVLFRQTRCGLNGRRFVLYKFRTMVEGADGRRQELQHLNEMDGPAFKVRQDPRVTPFGRILRRFSLDEVPQLWNVLRGDMSLVGPRPPIPEEVDQYARWQRRRLSMKPGLTCLWQISGRNNLDFRRWMELDLEYIDSWSPMLDLKILLRTIPAVLSGRGAS